MESRALIAAAISLFILMVYQGFVMPWLYPNMGQPDPMQPLPVERMAEAGPDAAPAPTDPSQAAVAAPAADSVPARLITIETDEFIATVSSRGARFESFGLKKHRTTVDPASPPQELILRGRDGQAPIAVELRGAGDADPSRVSVLADANAPYRTSTAEDRIVLTAGETATVDFEWQSPGGLIRKSFSFQGDRPDFSLTVGASGVSGRYTELGVSYATGTKDGHTPLFDRASHLQDKKLVEHYAGASELTEGEIVPKETPWSWTTISGGHFLVALIPIEAHQPRLWVKERDNELEQKVLLPLSGGNFEQRFDVYLGSKGFAVLDRVGFNLSRAVEMGWFSFIALPLLWMLRRSHEITGNYGVDIIALTVLIKLIFYPLTRKSFQSMKAMQQLQPQMTQLRERLKDQPDQLNKEVMDLYKRHGVNPLGGCLPMLVQIPVFVGLYQALLNAVELRHAPFGLWINDLSAPDRLGSLAIPFIDPPGIPVLTLVMGATMFLQQYMTPSTGDPTQRQMMMIMPVMFTFMFISFPAGLVLYWTVNNVLTVAQQYYINQAKA